MLARGFEVQLVAARETVPLRHAVLRPHQPIDEIYATADEPPDGHHFAAITRGAVIGVASLYHEPLPGRRALESAWRLRGMAVRGEHRKLGVGRALVEACLDAARNVGATLVWCNARTTASGFYERCGFETRGAAFLLPNIGPHVLMECAIATTSTVPRG
ncbi:MAG: GNAT family N-acetyltransferase [Deltaproteobacteria bacterium]|nr:GNAT family N-acetyltransferase [Deltaproteobacteria bacterium]